MRLIAKDKELVEYLTGGFSLISSKIYKLEMYLIDDELTIDIYLKLIYPKENNLIKLNFIGIKEFSIFYTHNYNFYNVESYKFIGNNNSFYISLDPFDDKEEISVDDQDYILSDSVEGYFLNTES